MTTDTGHRGLMDLRPLRTPAYARLWIGTTLSGLGGQLTTVAVMLHVYALTQNTFAVSMIAIGGLLPMIAAGLYGGMLADAFDRRTVALVAATTTFASTVLLAALAWGGLESVTAGYAWTYTIDVVLMLSLLLGLWTLPRVRPEGAIARPGLESLRDGWRFLRSASNIRLQYVLDIVAMTFGHPIALFPAIGAVLLGGGAITTGVLTASLAVGAFLSSLVSGPIGRVRRQGLGIERSILVYGLAIALFGLVLGAAALGWFTPAVTSLWFPPLLGGFVILGLVGLLVRLSPRFREYDATAPQP